MGSTTVLSSYFQNTSAHGFPSICRSKCWFRRLIWVIVVIGALLLLAYQLYTVLLEYLQYPKTVTMEVMDPSAVHFPAVSICSLHVLNASRIKESDIADGPFHDLAKISSKSNKTANTTAKIKRDISKSDWLSFRNDIEEKISNLVNESFKINRVDQFRGAFDYPIGEIKIQNSSKQLRHKRSTSLNASVSSVSKIGKSAAKPISNKIKNVASNNILNPLTNVTNAMKNITSVKSIVPDLSEVQDLITQSVMGKVTQMMLSQVNALTSNLTEVVTTKVMSKILDAEIINQLTKLVTKAIVPDLAKILVDTGVGTILNGVVSSQLIDSVTDILGSVPALLKDVLNRPITREDFKKFGIRAKDFILGCSFDRKACSYANFTEWQNERYGNCFTFNGKSSSWRNLTEMYETRKFGSGYGLRLLLKITSKEEDIPLFSPNSGVRVIVHSSDDWAYPEDQGVNVPPRMAASIAINKRVINRITPPHGKCTNDTDIYNWNKISNGLRYSRKGCFKICRSKAILQECRCAQDMRISEFLDPNAPQCNSETKSNVACIERVLAKINCTCDPSCLEESYDVNIAYSLINAEYLCVGGMMGIDDGIVDKSLCEIDPNVLVQTGIYFSELSYAQVTETPTYTLASLLSNMGGTMGLFLGLSVVSIIEVMELIFDLFFSCCCSCCMSGFKSAITPIGAK